MSWLRMWVLKAGKSAERYRSGRTGLDSKSSCPVKSRARGFESHPLRHIKASGQCSVIREGLFTDNRSPATDHYLRRDVREAEGARLEIVCTPKRCTEGSNPSLSATLPSRFAGVVFPPAGTACFGHALGNANPGEDPARPNRLCPMKL